MAAHLSRPVCAPLRRALSNSISLRMRNSTSLLLAASAGALPWASREQKDTRTACGQAPAGPANRKRGQEVVTHSCNAGRSSSSRRSSRSVIVFSFLRQAAGERHTHAAGVGASQGYARGRGGALKAAARAEHTLCG